MDGEHSCIVEIMRTSIESDGLRHHNFISGKLIFTYSGTQESLKNFIYDLEKAINQSPNMCTSAIAPWKLNVGEV